MPKDIPAIVEIPLKSLVIDESLSGRTKKEIAINAKELAPMMEAAGLWDSNQPGQFFVRDGKKHVVAGFTRLAAAEIANIKIGYFTEVKDDPAMLRTACLRTNLGKPINRREQGRIYAAMRDGTPDAETAPKGTVILAPMEIKAIADEVGYTRQHVEACIGMFEETEEIGELIESGAVAVNVITRARQLVKADGKRLAFLKAAVRAAKEDGKECATMKHLDAVRAEYAPMKADKPDAPEKPSKANGKATKKGKDEEAAQAESQADMELGPALPNKKATLTRDETVALMMSAIMSADDDVKPAVAERIALALIAAGFGIVASSPL